MEILLVEYKEPDFKATIQCCEKTRLPITIVSRDPEGVGSLSEAINRGIKLIKSDVCWIVTNVEFDSIRNELNLAEMSILWNKNIGAINPVYVSDHLHLRPQKTGYRTIPFIEFTCPIVKTELLLKNPLDESMPYWGMDLDWSKRIKDQGFTLHAYDDILIHHTYIRNTSKKNPFTNLRAEKRIQTNGQTHSRLIEKYGNDWRNVLSYI